MGTSVYVVYIVSLIACATAYYYGYGWANENPNAYPNQWYQSNQWGNVGSRFRRPGAASYGAQRNGYGYQGQSPMPSAAGGGYAGGRSMGLTGQSYYDSEQELLQQDQAYSSPYVGARSDQFRAGPAARRQRRPAAQSQQQWDMISDGTGAASGQAVSARPANGQRQRSRLGVAAGAGARLNQKPIAPVRQVRPGQDTAPGQVRRPRPGMPARLRPVQQTSGTPGFGRGPQKEAIASEQQCVVDDGTGVLSAKWCHPEMEAAALYKQVAASSTCGQSAQQSYCRPPSAPEAGGSAGRVRWPEIVCGKCDSRVPLRSHSAALLTDAQSALNQTCWLSEPLRRNEENVTLEVAFGKRYEVYYISLKFCTVLADLVLVQKSADFGRTWSTFHTFSSRCPGSASRTSRNVPAVLHPLEPLCTNPHDDQASKSSEPRMSSSFVRIPQNEAEESALQQEWMTASNVRVVLARMYPRAQLGPNEMWAANSGVLEAFDSKAFVYGISDLAIGARCKCNGHAGRCMRGAEGRLVCDCRHGTAGDDCERCRPFFNDAPWERATPARPYRCQRCNCNGHSRTCRLNNELYRQSLAETGRGSGGECLYCRHHTTGRHCELCLPGYYRDTSVPLTSPEGCKPCACHSLGTVANGTCDARTGQCPCREGLTRRRCDICAPGYKQSDNAVEPCIMIQPNPSSNNLMQKNPPAASETPCPACPSGRRLRPIDYCGADFAVQVNVFRQENLKNAKWVRFAALINSVFKNRRGGNWSAEQLLLYVRSEDLRCNCPAMRSDSQYLLIAREVGVPSDVQQLVGGGRPSEGQSGAGAGRQAAVGSANATRVKELWLTDHAHVFPWRADWSVRLQRLMGRERTQALCGSGTGFEQDYTE